ncbi:MAG TPA: hypothetical protein VMY36_01325 [Patescibacteria group bacterium]|nr:hypothetical protein [Patescibacteria group bacterium]
MLGHFKYSHYWGAGVYLILSSALFFVKGDRKKWKNKQNYLSKIRGEIIRDLSYALICLIAFFILSANIYSENRYPAYDPWTVHPVSQEIINGNLNFFGELKIWDLDFYKGFYFTHAFYANNSPMPVRYWGLISFCLISGLFYLIFINNYNNLLIGISILFALSSGRIIFRFSMPIRENFALVFLIFFVYLLHKLFRKRRQNISALLKLIIPLTLLGFSHSFASVFVSLFIILNIFEELLTFFSLQKKEALYRSMLLVGSLLIATILSYKGLVLILIKLILGESFV